MSYSCMNCTVRAVGCHGSCERYAAEKAERDAAKAARSKEYLPIAVLRAGCDKRKKAYSKAKVTGGMV